MSNEGQKFFYDNATIGAAKPEILLEKPTKRPHKMTLFDLDRLGSDKKENDDISPRKYAACR